MHAPPSLSELQADFARAMIDGSAPTLLPWINTRGIEPAARLQIYRNSILATQVAALDSSFPAVERMLGVDCFDGWATRYAAWQGSHSGNLQNLGDDFAEYLQAQTELADLYWLGDLARLDWLRQCTILAADAVALEPLSMQAALARVGDDPTLHLLPCVHAITADFPLLDLWRFSEAPNDVSVDPAGAAQGVLLWREDGQVAMQTCTPATVAFVTTLKHGGRLTAAIAAAHVIDHAAPIDSLLGPLLVRALIHHISDH